MFFLDRKKGNDMRLFESIYFRIRAKDLVDGVNARGRKILRYIEARWSR